jgi:c-di-GMP-related signal transduction protein
MEILKPVEQLVREIQTQSEPTDETISSVNPKTIEMLKYLGLETSLYDNDVMDKINEIVEFLGDQDVMEFDLKLGNPYGISRLDKIYSYIRLAKQSEEIRRKDSLLRQEMNKYDTL